MNEHLSLYLLGFFTATFLLGLGFCIYDVLTAKNVEHMDPGWDADPTPAGLKDPVQPPLECAWCKKLIRHGHPLLPVSHGVCTECSHKVVTDFITAITPATQPPSVSVPASPCPSAPHPSHQSDPSHSPVPHHH